MRKWVVILIGVILVIIGSLVLIKDAFGESIEAAAEAIAVNSVAVKINKSLEQGFYDESLGESLLHIERDAEGNIQYVEPDSRVINKLLLSFSQNVEENIQFVRYGRTQGKFGRHNGQPDTISAAVLYNCKSTAPKSD